MLRLRVLEDARREYAEAVRWYLDEDVDVARDMVAEYIAPAGLLAESAREDQAMSRGADASSTSHGDSVIVAVYLRGCVWSSTVTLPAVRSSSAAGSLSCTVSLACTGLPPATSQSR